MDIRSKYNRPERVPEKNDQVTMTETAGYIPAQLQIKRLVDAGKQHLLNKSQAYDYPEGAPDDGYLAPDRRRNYDIADAHQELMATKANFKSRKKRESAEIEAKKIEEAEAEKPLMPDPDNG